MNNKKNIDRLFQEKFKDFEIAPNDAVWDRINESLPKKKKKRRVIALWWQVGGVAALLALLFAIGNSVFNTNNTSGEDPAIVNTKDKNNSENNIDNNILSNDELNYSAEFEEKKLAESNKNKESNTEDSQINISKKTNILTISEDSQLNTVANNFNEKKEHTTAQKQKHITSVVNKENSTKGTVNTNNSQKTNSVNKSELKSVIKTTVNNRETAITENLKSENSSSENITSATSDNVEKEKETLAENSKKQSIENAIATQETIDEKEKEDDQSRWSIKPNVAPVYFSSLGQGSSIDGQFNTNTKSSDINMSYGITGSYAVSKKLKIRAGVNRLNLNQTTTDVFAFTSGEFAARGAVSHMRNINTKDGLHNVALMSTNMFNRSSTPEIFNTKISGNIEQRFGFIEVPLELEYRVLDKKFGMNLIGGFSTFFLNENEIYADINGSSTLIGEANNINSTSFSANLGLGLDYSLSKQWNINLEPQFKYQINTFNNTSGNYRPYFIGVYTGLSFKF